MSIWGDTEFTLVVGSIAIATRINFRQSEQRPRNLYSFVDKDPV